MATLKLEIVTPDRKVLSEDVEYVGAPGILGEFGVLPSHVPFLSALGIGNLHYKQSGQGALRLRLRWIRRGQQQQGHHPGRSC